MGREGAKTVLQPGNRSSPLAPASGSAAGTRLGILQAGTHSDPGSQGQLSPLDKGGNGLEGSDRLPRGGKTSLPAVCPTMGRTLSRGRPRIRARGRQGKDGLRVYLPKEETRVETGDDR